MCIIAAAHQQPKHPCTHQTTNRIISPRTTPPTLVRISPPHAILPPDTKGYDFSPNISGWKRPRDRPKVDGLIPASTTSILLGATPPMLPGWSLTDPSGRPLLADSHISNPSKALKTSQVNSILIQQRNHRRNKTIESSELIEILAKIT